MGQGPNVVVDWLDKARLVRGSEVYIDNLFISLKLLAEMSARGFGWTGTMQHNCLNNVSLPKERELSHKNMEQGTFQTAYCGDHVCVCIYVYIYI